MTTDFAGPFGPRTSAVGVRVRFQEWAPGPAVPSVNAHDRLLTSTSMPLGWGIRTKNFDTIPGSIMK